MTLQFCFPSLIPLHFWHLVLDSKLSVLSGFTTIWFIQKTVHSYIVESANRTNMYKIHWLFKCICLQCSKYLPNSCSVPSKFIFQCNLENAVLANMNILKKFMKAKSTYKKDKIACNQWRTKWRNSSLAPYDVYP